MSIVKADAWTVFHTTAKIKSELCRLREGAGTGQGAPGRRVSAARRAPRAQERTSRPVPSDAEV